MYLVKVRYLKGNVECVSIGITGLKFVMVDLIFLSSVWLLQYPL